MLNNYAETSSGFNNNHGQTSRTTETQKQQNIGSTWSYNSQLEGMYYGSDHQPMFMGPYDGSSKHTNYPQYPAGGIHQPVPTPVVKCHEACCQHFQDRYPAPLRYQPSGPVQPRFTDLSNTDSRQYFTDRRSMQPSRKKVFPSENGYPGIPDRHFPQYMSRGQLHMGDSRQQMQMMRSQYPVYPPYWGSTRGWTGSRMNCPPPPPYQQSGNQGAQLQAGLKMTDSTHYMESPAQRALSAQHRRGVGAGSGGTDIIRPVPEAKRPPFDPNLQGCYEFGYQTGFVPFSEVNKIQGSGLVPQSGNSTCKIPSDKQYHPHQLQYPMQSGDRNSMNCSTNNDLSYPMNFQLPGSDPYVRSGLEDGQQVSDARKLPLQYDTSGGKKRPELDLRQYITTWDDDEDESSRLAEPIPLGNNGAPYIVVDCRSLEGDAAAKLEERFKTPSSLNCLTKQRSSSPGTEHKRSDDPRQEENSERAGMHSDFQSQSSFAPSMPNIMSDSNKSSNFWDNSNREGEGIIGKGGAFQPLDCSKRDNNLDSSSSAKRDVHSHNDLSGHKVPSVNDSANMSFDALVSYYGDNRRMTDGGYDFVEMTERLVNNSDKTSSNSRPTDHQISTEITRPCDPRLQQSQLGNNPSIYNKMTPRYPVNSYQHFKPGLPADPYYNYKHPIGSSKYYGYDGSQIIDPNYDYHKIPSEFDSGRIYGNKELQKDPRRIYHQEMDKTVESAFFDPLRKGQAECFQDKNLEFGGVDPDQFISPIIIKKSELENRDKRYFEKNSSVKERIDAINNEGLSQDKSVLITSQNGPSEVFSVPYSPEKGLSEKDNVVTLHSGDQNKSNTITVEVPYVQQYSTLVKLSEEISRSDNSSDRTSQSAANTVNETTSHEENKKPTSFKLKRLPNSKEWTVEGKDRNETNKNELSEHETSLEQNTPCELDDSGESVKSSVAVSNLNMPSLDDIRDGEENCDAINENQAKQKINEELLCLNKANASCEDVSKSKYNMQVPQMAIVQPMKLNQPQNESGQLDVGSKLPKDVNNENEIQKSLGPSDINNEIQSNFVSENIIAEEKSHVESASENDISKHENFRTHKKIQSSFSTTLPNCLASPSEDFLNPQDMNGSDGPKEAYSPFHVYADCDMNSQITDYFKIDERSATGEKILDPRIPSSPGVEGMFEDINHSNQTQLYQSKACNFQDLTGADITTLEVDNSQFQSFSNIFSEDTDKKGRPDGSILQMNDKKYLKQIFDDIDDHQMSNSIEEEVKRLESSTMSETLLNKCDDTKKSPPIPPISLKLNETKKIWCIAKKDNQSSSDQESLSTELAKELEQDLAEAIEKETNKLHADLNNEDQCKSNKHKNHVDQSDFTLTSYPFNKNTVNQIGSNNVLSDIDFAVFPEKVPASLRHKQGKSEYQSKATKRCVSLAKYSSRNSLLKKLLLSNNMNLISDTLIFDETGKHFPDELGRSQIEESKIIAQDVLDHLIATCVSYCTSEKTSRVELSSTGSNTTETDDDAKSTINLECSREHRTQEKENIVAETTAIFIQREKESCQHYSVIKKIQSEEITHSIVKRKKSERSIFSPRSEEEGDENILDSKCQDTEQDRIMILDENTPVKNSSENVDHSNSFGSEEITNDFSKIGSSDDITKTHASTLEEHKITNKSICEQVSDVQMTMPESSLKETILFNEEFKGFGSPKSSSCNQSGKESIINYSEVGNTPESMILSEAKSADGCGVLSEKCTENGNQFKNACSAKEMITDCGFPDSNKKSTQTQMEFDTEILVNKKNLVNNLKEVDQKKDDVKVNTIRGESLSNEVFDKDDVSDNLKPACTIKECESSTGTHTHLSEESVKVDTSSSSQVNYSETTSLGCEKFSDNDKVLSSENSPQNENDSDVNYSVSSTSTCQENTSLPPKNKQETLQRNSEDLFSAKTNNETVKQSTVPEDERSVISSGTNIQHSIQQSRISTISEDIETRLETSVIVRNNACSSIVPNPFSEISSDLVEKSAFSPISKQVSVINTDKLSDGSKYSSEISGDANLVKELDKDLKTLRWKELDEMSYEITCNRFPEERYKISDKNVDNSFALEFDNSTSFGLDLSSKISNLRYEEENDALSLRVEESVKKQPVHMSQASVIVPKHSGHLDSLAKCKPSHKVFETEKLSYCIGEAVIMNFKKEIEMSAYKQHLSYFHDFKKRKWLKFSKLLNQKDFLPIENQCDEGKIHEREYSIINYSTQHKEMASGEFSDSGHFLESKQSDNTDTSDFEMEQQNRTNVMYPVKSNDEIDPSSKNNEVLELSTNKTPEVLNDSEQIRDIRHVIQDRESGLSSIEKNNADFKEVKNLTVPLKNKSLYFPSKESNIFHIKRDLLKLPEPEAVLKEIFSPDPEPDDSESKENECPQNMSQEKPMLTVPTLPVISKESKLDIDHSCIQELSDNLTKTKDNIAEKTSCYNGKIIKDDVIENRNQNELECLIESSDLISSVEIEQTKVTCSGAVSLTVKNTELDVAELLTSQRSDTIIKVAKSTHKTCTFSCESGVEDVSKSCDLEKDDKLSKNLNTEHQPTKDTASISAYNSEIDIPFIQRNEKDKMSKLSPPKHEVNSSSFPIKGSFIQGLDCPEHSSTPPNKFDIPLQLQSCNTDNYISEEINLDRSSESSNSPCQITGEIASSVQDCQSDDCSEGQKTLMDSYHPKESNRNSIHLTYDENHADSLHHDSEVTSFSMPKTIQEDKFDLTCQDSDVIKSCCVIEVDGKTMLLPDNSNISNCLTQAEDWDKTTVITGKDVLLSTTQDENEQVQNSNSKDIGSEQLCVEEYRERNFGNENEKINCVHDSLRNCQHLNKETFPLQCLVEAALALENVDSKQMLLNNSSYSEFFSQSCESAKPSNYSDDKLTNGNFAHSDISNAFATDNINDLSKDVTPRKNTLTPADREIFSRFEETNYNLRASTRIVTSSSSNIIPYSKRKYGLKSKLSNQSIENKEKKCDSSVIEKGRAKKRRGGFTYPCSKRRKKVKKGRNQKCQQDPLQLNEPIVNNGNNLDIESFKNGFVKEADLKSKSINDEKVDSDHVKTSINETEECFADRITYPDPHPIEKSSKNDFGGPLIIASESTSTEGNILCVHVNSDKMDEYMNNLSLGELEVGLLPENNHDSFKEDTIENNCSDISNVTLENGTSLVIIIEELDDNIDQNHYGVSNKCESDIILSSVNRDCTVPCLPQTHSLLDDCSDLLGSQLSVNNSCVCPPDLEKMSNSQNELTKKKTYDVVENETLVTKSALEIHANIIDSYSAQCNQELLTTNCYEEINTNLVNDIGNWPFVEEEVAEFDQKLELPNKIPEEGRKIELKCSLPWKKIFNMTKSKKKKSKTMTKVSGLELGPAKVEVRLRAPSAEWKVISDYHENASPVVKVKRLILQRDLDGSSLSEKDSEEENEKRHLSSSDPESSDDNSKSNEQIFPNVLKENGQKLDQSMLNVENWQPVVLLMRNKELDELNLSLDTKLNSSSSQSSCQQTLPTSSFFSSCNLETSNVNHSPESSTESEVSDLLNENEQSSPSHYSDINDHSTSSQHLENEPASDSTRLLLEDLVECSYSYRGKASKAPTYETYSPSTGLETSAIEKIYSPSDPHYSPGSAFQESDSNSLFGPITNSESLSDSNDEDSDLLFNKVDLKQVENVECISSCIENLLLEKKVLSNSNSLTQPGEINRIDNCETPKTLLFSSSCDQISKEITSHNSHDLDSDPVVNENVERNKDEARKTVSALESNDIQKSEENKEKPSGPCKEISFDQKKKGKRKMPKNFFVRKKLRKCKSEHDSTGEKSLVNEDGVRNSENRVDTKLSSESVSDRAEVEAKQGPAKSFPSDNSESEKSSSGSSRHVNASESDLSSLCENSRLKCVYDADDLPALRLNEAPLAERFEVKQRLRDAGRGLKRPCEGHSKEDTKRRRKKPKTNASRCQECDIRFKNKEELCRHNAYKHARRRELHHCLLCQRSFSSAVRHSLHLQGRSHRHLELTQRHTMHTMHRLLTGTECPLIPPLTRTEQRALEWRPAQTGYTHFYHGLAPLQIALQERSSDVSEETLSEGRITND